ncbi:uncharacterized protein LOC127006694 [Eriocheir sinensis]|uniref:uncharacterized protein LOC127006694 n=1 Tax=Eriocheir sinensis TaxID=95602 RepID=UPI0021C87905|nr:uncharacterized protein LOC127006694 [Eriocheir sinensis]XP_050732856.1 uncharacterized protein LOC127006694 [Eriocheir sinensis]XP_050732857.1 uncharacterized protein LOC127006694 [Eriocheir sinensis]XP_050732858.1 uncharacterized protein LOC127006694 [Eriocheir sinensis]
MCGRHRAAWAALALCLWSSVVWVGAGEGRRTRLVTKTAEEEEEGEVLPRPGASTREREIAAIFRGVAYGAPTTTTTTSTTTTTTTSTTTSTTTTTRPTAAGRPPDHRREGAAGGASQPASRRDEGQKGSGGIEPARALPPLAGGEGVVNITTEVWRGAAWGARVYLTGGLFCVVGVAALCLVPRAAHASPLLAVPHFLALHLLVLAAVVCRCLHLLHDAPHVVPTLPAPLLTAAEEGAWPLLTAGLAVLVGGALRAWFSPSRPRLALVLAGAAAAHLASLAVTHLGAALLRVPHNPIALAASTVAITCGTAVGVAGLWAVWPFGRSASAMGRVEDGGEACGGPSPPSHLLLAASIVELLLAGARMFLLIAPPTLGPAWARWFHLTLPHLLEMLLASLLLAAAALTAGPPAGIFYCGCCQKRTAELMHPSAVKMVHPLGVYTVEEVAAAPPKNQHARTLAALSVGGGSTTKLKHRDHKSLDYVTSDFQLVWSHVRPLAAPHSGHRLDAADDFLTLPAEKPDLPRAHLLPLASAGVVGTEVFTCTLPSYRLYAAAPAAPYHTERGGGAGRGGGVGPGLPYRHSATLSRGSSGRVYSSPQASLRASRSWDELSTSHIYEEPQRATSGSVEEALSDLSDLVTDCPSDPASPDPPPRTRRRYPPPLHHDSSTLTVPGKQHSQRSREPLPLPGTPPPTSQTLPLLPPATTPSSIHPPKNLHSRV